MTAFLTWPMIVGAKPSSVGSRSACGVTTTRVVCVEHRANPVVIGPPQRDQIHRPLEELACSASRCGSSASSNGRNVSATALEVAINGARPGPHPVDSDKDSRAPRHRFHPLDHRCPSGRVGAKRERLMFPNWGCSPGRPSDLPLAFVADHLEDAVIGPRPILRQRPGEPIVHAAGVLGVTRAQDLTIQVGGLQTRPGLVECRASVGRPVGKFGRAARIPFARSAKNCSAAGAGPSGRGCTPTAPQPSPRL